MKAVIYAAKSTEDKHGSIPTQLEDCRARAEREGWEVVGEFTDEAFSAYHGNRGPGLERAKALAVATAAEHGRCVLVAQDADRFARGAGDAPGAADHLGEVYFAMRRQGVALWSVRTGRTRPAPSRPRRRACQRREPAQEPVGDGGPQAPGRARAPVGALCR